MAGFQTSPEQQLWRRLIRAMPLRCLIYVVAAIGWAIGPEIRPIEPGTLRGELGWILGMMHIAAVEFGLAAHTEGAWRGPAWAQGNRILRRWLLPLATLTLGFLGALAVRWTLAVETPFPLLGVQVTVALLWYGTIKQTLKQPPDRRDVTERFAQDQLKFMSAIAQRGQPIRSDEEMRMAVLAVLVDQPDNQAARLLAWQLAMKADDHTDAEHQVQHLERVEFQRRDLTEIKALSALSSGKPEVAVEMLEERVEMVRADPCRTHAGQRSDFIAFLHLAFAFFRAGRWKRLAQCLDDIGADYETAPFVGVIDRLIVNHLRWKAANELHTVEVTQEIEKRCRRFSRRSVNRAERRLLALESKRQAPEAVRWWETLAVESIMWWRENRLRR